MSSPGGYDAKTVEAEIYAAWEAGGHFHAEPDATRQPFVITIPPPNVTGALHLGHALNNTLQDMMIRRKRMQGFNACWLPGTDHAGIATQAVVEKRLREEQKLTRQQIGREGLVQKIWEWKEEYNTRILNQLRRMGCSCDWPRTRFTLDEQCAKAVYETFFRFFSDGLIYRGLRLVNWDTQLQTAVADDEVYHEKVRTNLWHIRYPLKDKADHRPLAGATHEEQGDHRPLAGATPHIPGQDYLVVATTRPETMLADTAVAVHPDDVRYQHLIGKMVTLPLTGRRVPVVADGMLVKSEFGTGCVKVTPGHDPNDYACYQRKLGQPDEIAARDLLTPDGRIQAGYGEYAGLKKDEARKKVVADLEAAGLLEKTEPYETETPFSDRSKTPIEPLRSEQWFVKMDRLAEQAMDAVRDGRVRFFPERYAKTYLDWLGEKRDWCISRQLWWGHRIPVWSRMTDRPTADRLRVTLDSTGVTTYADAVVLNEEPATDGRVIQRVCLIDPERDAIAGILQREGFDRDPDVLDTWFSSALWPHSTFGWPDGDAKSFRRVMSRREWADWSQRNTSATLLVGQAMRGLRTTVETRAGKRFELAGSPADYESLARLRDSVDQDEPLNWTVTTDNPDAEFAHETLPGQENLVPPRKGPISARDWLLKNGFSAMRDLDYFYPTSVLSTAREIITLWVARMVMTGLYNVGRVPFQHVYIHAVIQDGQGKRMSKSAGNGVDPLDIIDAYGADALRFTLAQLATETQDIRIPVKPTQLPDGRTVNTSEKFELGRNLVTKLWQAANGFVIPTCRDLRIEAEDKRGSTALHTSRPPGEMPLFEKWIRVKLLACIAEVDRRMERYEFSAAVDAVRSFFWNDLCDWYIEEVKSHLRDAPASGRSIEEADAEKNDVKITLLQVFDIVLCLFHPAMPFVTEAIWKLLRSEIPRHFELIWPDDRPLPAEAPMLIAMPWPRAAGASWLAEVAAQTAAEREVDHFLGVIRALREIRTSLNSIRSASKQPALKTLPAAVIRCDAATATLLRGGEATIARLGQIERGGLTIGADAARPPQSMSRVLTFASAVGSEKSATPIEVYVGIAGLADIDVERKRLGKDRDETAAAIQRLQARLTSDAFVSKAKPEIVEAERARAVELAEKLEAISRNLAELG